MIVLVFLVILCKLYEKHPVGGVFVCIAMQRVGAASKVGSAVGFGHFAECLPFLEGSTGFVRHRRFQQQGVFVWHATTSTSACTSQLNAKWS